MGNISTRVVCCCRCRRLRSCRLRTCHCRLRACRYRLRACRCRLRACGVRLRRRDLSGRGIVRGRRCRF